MASKGQKLALEYKLAKQDRAWYHPTWDELAEYLLPREGGFAAPLNKGERLNSKIYDSTGPHALQIAAAGLYSRASNPATRWFNLKASKDFQDDRDVQIWLQDTRDRMAAVINSQLAEPLYQTYQSMLGFGTAILFIDEDPVNIVRGHAFKLKDIYLKQDGFGQVSRVFRKLDLTISQAEDLFGHDALPEEIKKVAAAGDKDLSTDTFEFVHFAAPRKNFDPRKTLDPKNLPLESVWFFAGTGEIIKESGFHEDPYATPRLDVVPGETYGRGPGLQALPDIRTVNQLMYFQIDGAGMALRPPLDVPEDAYASPLKLFPGAENLNQDRSGRRATAMFDVAGNLGISFQLVEERRAAIRQIFFNDQLQLINPSRDMTAFEVDQRQQQQMLLMGPWHGRLERELFQKMIQRVFGIMDRRGLLMAEPEQMRDSKISITYESPLARAQRQVDVSAIDRTMEFIMPLAQFGVQDNFDIDEMARDRATALGLPEVHKKEEAEVLAARKAAQEQQALMQAQEQQALLSQQLGNAHDAADLQEKAPPEGAPVEEES